MDRREPQAPLTPRRAGASLPGDRHGYALLAVIIVVGVMAMTAAAIGPSLAREFRVRQIRYAVATLEGIWNASIAFYDHVSDWPGSLTHLVTPIADSDLNLCGQRYGPGKSSAWQGPYLMRMVPGTGLPIEIGTVSNTVIREKNTGSSMDSYGTVGSPNLLVLEITGVSLETAYDLNRAIDDDYSDPVSGKVQWGDPDAQGLVTVRYRNRIIAC